MQIGIALPQCGDFAHPDVLEKVVDFAEAQGFSSLWTFDRLLHPVEPKNPYPASADGKLPQKTRAVLDPIEALTYAAARSRRVRLGTSVLNMPFYNPVVLARQLTALDVLSRGRLTVGLGLGWSEDEFEATGSSASGRGQLADEFLQVLKVIWTQSPAHHQGPLYRLPASHLDLKPVQKPHPPILLAAYTPGSMRRVADQAQGWNPAGLPLPALTSMWQGIRQMAEAAGRDPAGLQLVARANIALLPQDVPGDRPPFVGSLAQIEQDLQAHAGAGVDEMILDLQFSPQITHIDDYLETSERLRLCLRK